MSEIEETSKKLSWGSELWDQYDNLSAHTSKGIQLLDKFANFIRDRIQIEAEYAAKLRKLAKNYQPKKIEDEEHELTSLQAFSNMLQQISEMAVHHEVFGESLKQRNLYGIMEFSNKLQQERKSCLHDYATLQQNLQSQLTELERAKRHYEKAFQESKKAIEHFRKADLDLNLSRAEVYRCNNLMHLKMQESDDAKLDYAKQLQKTNSFQAQHYAELIPAVFDRLQLLDQKRSKGIGDFIVSTANVEMAMLPMMADSLMIMQKTGQQIDEEHDSKQIINRFRTGLTKPADIPFEDLGKQEQQRALPLKSAKSGSALRKDVAFFKIYKSIKQRKISEACITFKNMLTTNHDNASAGELSSSQRKKLHSKISDLNKKIKKETDAYTNLMKLKSDNDAASGDPSKISEQLIQLNTKIEKLKAEVSKLQECLGNPPQERSPGISKENIHIVLTEIDESIESVEVQRQIFKTSIPESNMSRVQNWLQHIDEVDSAEPAETNLNTSRTSTEDSGKGSADEITVEVTAEAAKSVQVIASCCNVDSLEENCGENSTINDSEGP